MSVIFGTFFSLTDLSLVSVLMRPLGGNFVPQRSQKMLCFSFDPSPFLHSATSLIQAVQLQAAREVN